MTTALDEFEEWIKKNVGDYPNDWNKALTAAQKKLEELKKKYKT